jgi:type IV secretion system protein VirB3
MIARDPIFKGCTRPAMLMGVPTLPMITLTVAFLLAGMWLFYLVSGFVTLFLILIYLPLLMTLKTITKRDDQRLRQLWLRARMRLRMGSIRQSWGAYTYSPIRYKKRS